MDVRVRPWKSWMPKNSCFWAVVLETTFESPLDCKKTTPLHPKGNQSSIFIGRTWWSWSSDTLATWCKELMHWERPLCWERLKMRGEVDDTGWDGCMASLTQWTWVWAGSGSWWWTGKPGLLQTMDRRLRTELTDMYNWCSLLYRSTKLENSYIPIRTFNKDFFIESKNCHSLNQPLIM